MHKIKYVFYTIISLALFTGNAAAEDNIFKEIADEISGIGKVITNKTIAVLPFESSDEKEKDEGKYYSDKIMHELVSSGKLAVVERKAIDRVLVEQELNMSGAVDADTAARIGKLLAVDAIILGTVNRRNDKVEIFVRAIDTKTGLVLKSVSKEFTDKAGSQTGFIDTWRVTKTAKYFKDNGIQYKKLILNDDDTYELHLINNANRLVVFKGVYEIDGNDIDYRPRKMFIDGNPTYLPSGAPQEGTIYIVEGRLFFNVIDMQRRNKRRLDAMDNRYRNIAERK